MKNGFFKLAMAMAVVVTVFVFNGCSEKDLAVQKKECLDQEKRFLTKKVLNYRTGEFVIKGQCV